MTKTLFILGRQPLIGVAEIESLFPTENIERIDNKIISLERSFEPNLINRLGGTVKIAEEITGINDYSDNLEQLIIKKVSEVIDSLPDGKVNFGISYYGNEQSVRDIERIAINVKRVIKKTGRSIRIVPNNDLELSSAQIFHNKLTNKTGFELIIVQSKNSIRLAKTFSVQNIESYTARDQKRPYRDAKIGMLPPKLAQIMINLCNPSKNSTVLDPFCGTGVILQESLLMGLPVVGTDIDDRMVEYSTNNLEWLNQKFKNLPSSRVSFGDATISTWHDEIDCVVSEIYLGHPFARTPSLEIINKENAFVYQLLYHFLKNIHSQIKPSTKLSSTVWAYFN